MNNEHISRFYARSVSEAAEIIQAQLPVMGRMEIQIPKNINTKIFMARVKSYLRNSTLACSVSRSDTRKAHCFLVIQ